MQLPATLTAAGRNISCTIALSSGFLALVALAGCTSVPAATPPKPDAITTTPTLPAHPVQVPNAEAAEVANTKSDHPVSTGHAESVRKDESLDNQTLAVDSLSAITENAQTPHSSHQRSHATTASMEQVELSRLKVEILSLRKKVDGLQRKFELVLKSQRTGIFQIESPEMIKTAVERVRITPNAIPPLSSEGPLDPFESEPATEAKNSTADAPQSLVDRALIHLSQADYAKVLQLLEDFQTRFPNNPLNGTASLALAEAYVELQSPQRALAHIRGFYLQHPNDVRMPNAKLFEARIQKQLKAYQKAAQLYREVIALAPRSDLALKARASLEKLSEGRTQ